MKKLLSLLLALCLVLGMATFVACSDSSDSTDPATTSYEVNAQEYQAALGLGDNFKMDMRVTVDDELTATTIVVDGDKIQMTSVQGADTYEIYASKDGDQYYLYGKVDGEWEKVPSNEYDYNNYKNIPANAIQFYAGTPLESFTYDANEKCYVMALSADGMDGTFKIFFENKKFKKVETVITYADPAETRITQIDVTYNVRVTLPDE